MSDSDSGSSKSPVTSTRFSKKVVCPRVWKRPHSTIYGKNVEFGSKLYSDKLGEINGRKFNSELPWQVRNTGAGSGASSSGSQGYISRLLLEPEFTLSGSVLCEAVAAKQRADFTRPSGASRPLDFQASLQRASANCRNYADLLDLTNPNKCGERARRIDFYAQYLDSYEHDVRQMGERSILLHEPLLHRRNFDKYLDFNHEIGVFVPSQPSVSHETSRANIMANCLMNHGFDSDSRISSSSSSSSRVVPSNEQHSFCCQRMPHEFCSSGNKDYLNHFQDDERSLIFKRSLEVNRSPLELRYAAPAEPAATTTKAAAAVALRATKNRLPARGHNHQVGVSRQHLINENQFNPVCTTTQQTNLLPKHACQLASSPYGQSADGRKLSLGSINPHSYRPSLPAKNSTVHASDGEEFEFQDKSSPFYTDR